MYVYIIYTHICVDSTTREPHITGRPSLTIISHEPCVRAHTGRKCASSGTE